MDGLDRVGTTTAAEGCLMRGRRDSMSGVGSPVLEKEVIDVER